MTCCAFAMRIVIGLVGLLVAIVCACVVAITITGMPDDRPEKHFKAPSYYKHYLNVPLDLGLIIAMIVLSLLVMMLSLTICCAKSQGIRITDLIFAIIAIIPPIIIAYGVYKKQELFVNPKGEENFKSGTDNIVQNAVLSQLNEMQEATAEMVIDLKCCWWGHNFSASGALGSVISGNAKETQELAKQSAACGVFQLAGSLAKDKNNFGFTDCKAKLAYEHLYEPYYRVLKFGAPALAGVVLILIIVLIISLCIPQRDYEGGGRASSSTSSSFSSSSSSS